MSTTSLNNDRISPNAIIRDASVLAADSEFKKGLTRGWYEQQLRNHLDDLSFKLKFEDITSDLKIPDDWNLQMKVPPNFSDINELYMWGGDECSPTSSIRVFLKDRLDNGVYGGDKYTAHVSNTNSANIPLVNNIVGYPANYYMPGTYVQPLVYANIKRGLIMFGPGAVNVTTTNPENGSAVLMTHIRIVGQGTMGAFDELPFIPRVLKTLLTDLVAMSVMQVFMTRDPRSGLAGIYDRINDKVYNNRTGTYWTAQKLIREMSQWERDDMATYQSRGNW